MSRGAIHRAALRAAEDTGTPYLVVGDVAAHLQGALDPDATRPKPLELWFKPDADHELESETQKKFWPKLYDYAQPAEGETAQLMAQVKVHREFPGNLVSFDAAYERAVDNNYCDRPVKAAAGDDLVTLMLSTAKTGDDINHANRVMNNLRGPSHDPGTPGDDEGPKL